ncbi:MULTISPECIES: 50S ribosomal protein L25/general stress protein Ctc [unclassified Beijerinckia]|uniref:50S ribosomal protein L25/general stress protein Ctc n=1 Tax=unclassified Beijerinckia TaxID=2638183 RepID=UPI00089A2E40|nr:MULTISPECIES: 50S ribosomal protein L25/general stress protein Ctc [unclassified Beijerinckia]MDH7799421.1 large subunit ribosomal protein L25 [Beijerinckia sp. GAS462]SED49832.1 LSU ribosomal protein L25P [Beijerinckia sp. 28-YEA-48]
MATAIKQLAATVRDGTGKGAARSVRRDGKVPGVIYGGGDAPQAISLDYKNLNQLIYAGHFLTTIFEVEIGGRKERVIPRDYQLDVVRDTPMHVDFLRLKPGSSLRVSLPVHFIGQETSPGIKQGGSLNIVLHSIEMRVPADNIPEALVADVSAMGINESLHFSAIALPEGCKPLTADRDFTIATIAPPAKAEETPAAAAAATAAAPAAGAAPAAAAKPAAKK